MHTENPGFDALEWALCALNTGLNAYADQMGYFFFLYLYHHFELPPLQTAKKPRIKFNRNKGIAIASKASSLTLSPKFPTSPPPLPISPFSPSLSFLHHTPREDNSGIKNNVFHNLFISMF
jgi:hypothetical protein